ncbi:MAG: hypothetical protein K0U74_02255, partial [Alphaproteobacteria bacterium]|nr:hypothetical protein [Alphaproteobacteria bacterium]
MASGRVAASNAPHPAIVLDVYFQKVVRFLHWRLSIRSGPGTLMLRNVSDSPEDRMNVHKNAPL